jgi:HEAT repeat protein
MAKRLICVALLAACFLGCAKDPPRSGGRTASDWAEVLQQPDVEQRRKAAVKLGPLTVNDPDALRTLLGALKDTDPGVRASAARSLGIFTKPAKAEEVLPALREMQQQDSDANAREAAAKAIEMLLNPPQEK